MITAQAESSLSEWQQAVRHLAEEISRWSREEGWSVEQTQEEIQDMRLGTYSVPALRIETPHGRLRLEPLPHALSGDGRVKLCAWPALYRVRLQRRDDGMGWVIWTDSGIPIHEDWNAKTFTTVARDLMAADW